MKENAAAPTEELRLAQRRMPSHRKHLMYHKWRDLLFLHWRWDPADLQRRLPPGLWVDSFDGSAWVGATPFFMRGVRPRWIPAVPIFSDFMEMNIRTYVYDAEGRPGVWFFSLDTNSVPAVVGARALLSLPYFAAEMRSEKSAGGAIEYSARRRGREQATRFAYRAGEGELEAEIGTLEFFLIERYLLFSYDGKDLLSARVHHRPYPLSEVEVPAWDANALAWDDLYPEKPHYDHAIYSAGVDVKVYPPQKAGKGGD